MKKETPGSSLAKTPPPAFHADLAGQLHRGRVSLRRSSSKEAEYRIFLMIQASLNGFWEC
ncbi:hypothetical protein [Desulfatirhabdium butyrativorans]|uniref:hypothetical protein n=1 Tax=Desulfatirhabdium butyrativorans TaxID=340467 RepID=UPI0012EC631E|nr:hypothetical protein [Desulfatirhabdium butyrativorans]